MKIVEFSLNDPPETFINEHYLALSKSKQNSVVLLHPSNQKPVVVNQGVNSLFNAKNRSLFAKLLGKVFKNYCFKSDLRNNYKLIQRYNPDILHFHFGWAVVFYYDLIQKLNIPYTISLRGSDILIDPFVKKDYKEKLEKAIQNCSGIHVVSEHVEENLLTNYKIQVPVKIIRTTINRGFHINTNYKNNVINKSEKKTIISVGRLHWVKDYTELILAFNELYKANKNLELIIIGEGHERIKLSFLIKKLQLEDSVKLMGNLSSEKIYESFQKAFLFVLTSWSEGFPNALIEAISSNVLSIVPDHLKIDAVFSENDVIFYNKFKPSDLTNKIDYALNLNEAEKQKMQKSAFQKVFTNFDDSNHANEFFAFFTEVLQQAKPKHYN